MQPRQDFDERALDQLAASIRESGLMQPILVRPLNLPGTEDQFQIIAGERRWRAAQRAGLTTIPAIVRELDDRQSAEFALLENLQREDLNPIERSEAFARLISEFGLMHEDIARRIGIDRTSVTNHLRLNELDASIKSDLRRGRLSMGHAKALLALTNLQDRSEFAMAAAGEQWSVRELERRVREHAASRAGAGGTGGVESAVATEGERPGARPHLADLERRLGEHLGTKIRLKPGRKKGAGTLSIDFYSIEQFEGLLARLGYESD